MTYRFACREAGLYKFFAITVGVWRSSSSFRAMTKQNCAARPTDCPPGPMSALGGSGRAAQKEEARF